LFQLKEQAMGCAAGGPGT